MHRTSMSVSAMLLLTLSAPASPLWSQDTSNMKPAYIKVIVPADAQLAFDGFKTEQAGEVRRFVSPPLPAGQRFKYTLKATWKSEGKDMAPKARIGFATADSGELGFANNIRALGGLPGFTYPDATQQGFKGDVVYDLGCGDARIPVTAAKKYKVKAYGYDIDPERIKDSLENVKKNKVEDLVTIQKKDIFTLDLKDANVVTLYLLPSLNVKLMPQLAKLKPGSRIVSHDFDMQGAKPKKIERVKAADHNGQVREHSIYLWIVPWEKE